MRNIVLITDKRKIKSKKYEDLFSYLDQLIVTESNIPVEVEIVDTEEADKFRLNTKSRNTLIVSLGGDGTALKAMKLGYKHNQDVLLIGSGRVGYLVNKIENISSIVDEYLQLKKARRDNISSLRPSDLEDNYIRRRPIIQNGDSSFTAFNEVVIIKNSPTRLLDLLIETYDQKVKLRSDGIIISTSLGSTAYNYSAGGPIVHNEIDSIVVTPISPFSKFPRSIVLSDKSKISVTIPKNQNYAIQFDGVVEVQEINEEKITYEYELSEGSVNLIGHDNNPKIDNFLNQILR